MFSWLAAIGHFFTSLFGKSGSVIQTVLHDAANFVNLAEPIVADLAQLAKDNPTQSGLVGAVAKWVVAYQSHEPTIQAWMSAASTLPVSEILRTGASLALNAIVPSGTAQSIINLAIELAYNAFKKGQPVNG